MTCKDSKASVEHKQTRADVKQDKDDFERFEFWAARQMALKRCDLIWTCLPDVWAKLDLRVCVFEPLRLRCSIVVNAVSITTSERSFDQPRHQTNRFSYQAIDDRFDRDRALQVIERWKRHACSGKPSSEGLTDGTSDKGINVGTIRFAAYPKITHMFCDYSNIWLRTKPA